MKVKHSLTVWLYYGVFSRVPAACSTLPPKSLPEPSHSILGDSLTELAVVLLIVACIRERLALRGETQMDIAEFNGTQERLANIRD